MSAEIVCPSASSAFVKTTARQVDRGYKKFKRLLLASGEYRARRNSAAHVPKYNTIVIPSASEGPLLHCWIAQINSRSPYRAREVPRCLRAHGTQVSDLCAQPTFCPLTVSAGYKPAGRTGPRPVFHQSNPNARKSSRGSSKLQLPNEVTNFRLSRSRLTSIFHSRHAKNSSVKESESALSSSSMSAVWPESHLYSAANTAAPSTFKKPCIFVCTSSRNIRSG